MFVISDPRQDLFLPFVTEYSNIINTYATEMV